MQEELLKEEVETPNQEEVIAKELDEEFMRWSRDVVRKCLPS